MRIAKEIGGFRSGYERAEDYEFVLRFVERTEKILHIPKILYHAREIPPLTDSSVNTQGNRTDSIGRVLKERLKRLRLTGTVVPGPFEGCFNVRYDIRGNPLISIIIPSAGRSVQIHGRSVDLLSNCINSIHEKSTYNNYEIIVVDNDDLKLSTIKAIKRKDCIFVHYKGPFNIAQKINLGAQYARGEYLLFLNDDTEVISPDWLTAMLQLAQRREIGVVGAKLCFEGGTIQHVGVTFIDGLPDHIYRGFPGRFPGYFFSSAVNRNYLAVTGACLMTRKEVFKRVEGFNEDFAINYNDIDYCLKVHEAGYRIVYASQAELFHHESKSRVRTVDPKEVHLFLRLWHFKTKQDPYYSIHLETRPPNFEIKV
jgi:GT2 family glycosyltransferase